MCAALPAEFWDGWQWSTGDLIAVPNTVKHTYEIYSIGTHDMESGRIGVFMTEEPEFEPEPIYTKLPRLDQLQERSCQKWDDFFRDCIDWKTDLEDPEIKSAEHAGLIMIMYENYGMIWTGETWEAGEY